MFEFPFIPPSTNHIYMIVPKRMILNKQAKQVKQDINKIVQTQIDLDRIDLNSLMVEGRKFKVDIEFYTKWYNKNGTIKKRDVANREKLLIDSIFETLGIDDKSIWDINLKKIHDETDKTIVNITPVLID